MPNKNLFRRIQRFVRRLYWLNLHPRLQPLLELFWFCLRPFFHRGKPTWLTFGCVVFYTGWNLFHGPTLPAEAVNPQAVIDAARSVIANRDDSFAALWNVYFSGDSNAYAQIIGLSKIIAGFVMGVVIFKWIRADDEGVYEEIGNTVIWTAVLLIATSLDGQLSSSAILLEKTVFDAYIARVDESIDAQPKYQAASAIAGLDTVMAPIFKKCEGTVGQAQQQCQAESYEQAVNVYDNVVDVVTSALPGGIGTIINNGSDAVTRRIGTVETLERWNERLDSLGEYITDPQKNPLDIAATTLWTVTAPEWEGIVKGLASAFATGAFHLIDSLTLAIALVAPLAAALSLIPVGTFSKAFFLWQSVFLVMYGWKLLLIMMDAISSDILLNASADVDTLWFGFVTGAFFPLLTLAAAALGGFQIFFNLHRLGNYFSGNISKKFAEAASRRGNSAPAPSIPRPASSRGSFVR